MSERSSNSEEVPVLHTFQDAYDLGYEHGYADGHAVAERDWKWRWAQRNLERKAVGTLIGISAIFLVLHIIWGINALEYLAVSVGFLMIAALWGYFLFVITQAVYKKAIALLRHK